MNCFKKNLSWPAAIIHLLLTLARARPEPLLPWDTLQGPCLLFYFSLHALLPLLLRRLFLFFGLLPLLFCRVLPLVFCLLFILPQPFAHPAIRFRPRYTDVAPRMATSNTSTSMKIDSRNIIQTTLAPRRSKITRTFTCHYTKATFKP